MKTLLTDRAMKAMKPAAPGTRKMIWDAAVPSFGARISEKGKITFIVMRRLHGKLVRRMLGQYPIMPLAEAREAALAALRDIAKGVDPKTKQDDERRAEAARNANSFAACAEEFIVRHVRKLRSGTANEATIRHELIERWRSKPITGITRHDIIKLLEEITDSERPYAAHKTYSHVNKFFSWAMARGLIATSPCIAIKPNEIIGAREARQRVLDDAEIRALWKATGSLGYPAAPFVRMLLLTGQRLREVGEMAWSEVDLEKSILVIPSDRMKGASAHEVPLSNAVVELLTSLPRFIGPYVFTTTGGRRPIGDYSKMKKRLDAAMTNPVAPWRFHDLRRTMRTGLGALPVPPNVAEMIIAHAQPGLHRVYDQHSYRDEKRRAFELWAARLLSIVEPGEASNIVSLAVRG